MKIIALFLISLSFSLTNCGAEDSKRMDASLGEDANKPFLYYLHGRIIEDLGPDNALSERFGKYEYTKILKTFEDEGFNVISEPRPKNTDVEDYSKKVARQIREQIKNGVSPSKINVIGASKGSLIAMLISTNLKNKDVKFVIMANCNQFIQENYKINLHGKILSIYEKTDTVGGNSCEAIKTASTGISEFKEIRINTKLDHGFLFKPLKEWVEPAIDWAR